MMRPTASSFAVLQDKFVNARAVRCCPTMDLLAVLTADRQLLVHVRGCVFLCAARETTIFMMVRCDWY